jgi:hypothetical protein
VLRKYLNPNTHFPSQKLAFELVCLCKEQ